MALPNLNNDESFTDAVRQSTDAQKDQMKLELQNLSTLGEIKSILQLQYEEQLAFRAEQRAAAEEARREQLNKLKPEKDKKTKEQAQAPGELGMGGILGITAIAGIVASLTGLDDVIRTIQLPETMKRLTKGFKGIGSAIGDIAVIITKYTKDFTKIATDFTKNLGRVVFNSKPFTDFAERMKKIFTFIGNASNSLKAIAINNLPNLLKPFTEFFKSMGNVFKTVGVESFQNAKNAFPSITNFFKNMFNFIDTAKAAVGGFALQTFESSKTAFTTFSGFLKTTFDFFSNVFGNVSRFAVGAFEGTKSAVSGFVKFLQPVTGFFTSAFKVIEPFVAPILNIAKIGGRALFGPILAIIDFVTGFVKGFAQSEGGTIESIMAGVREGIFEIFRGFVTFPLDLIKNGLSWVFGKMGFEGGVDALDSFSFTDVFNKLVKGDFDIMGKIGRFISGVYEGIMDLIPSVEDVVLGAISLIPFETARNYALEKAQEFGLVGETGAKKLEASEKQSDLQETESKIENLESKDKLSKGQKNALERLKKERDEQKKKLDSLQDEVRLAEKINDPRTNEELREQFNQGTRESVSYRILKDRAQMDPETAILYDGSDRQLSREETRAAIEQAQKEVAEREGKATEALNILTARRTRAAVEEDKQKTEALRAKIEDELIDTLGDGNTAIGQARYRRLTQEQKDALIESKMGDAEEGLAKALIGGKTTGYAVDAGSRAAAEAANQNQQINVVAPQTDASVTNQTTNNYASPGPAQAVNPDSTFRRGLFVQDI